MSTFRKLQVVEFDSDFRKATKITESPIPTTVQPNKVLIKVFYTGVNATDLNAIQNRYGPKLVLPYDIGLEALGKVVLAGTDVKNLAVDDYIVCYSLGGYAEYQEVSSEACVKIPEPAPEYLAMNVSAMTAAVSIGELGHPKEGEVALVTAAAGGTGAFAVQLLKHQYGCRVIGTCGSAEKAEFLRSIGCDVVINYKKPNEEVEKELRDAAPNGLNIVYECVGGSLSAIAMRHLAPNGRFILIGGISGYKDGSAFVAENGVDTQGFLDQGDNLNKGTSINGFLLPHFRECIPKYSEEVFKLFQDGKLRVRCDLTMPAGLEHAAEAVEHLHSGKSYGKVVLKITDPE